ncbi:CoA transferase subunit A [Clostridium magnum]|uniref:Acetate CoA-transferase subunit alpha n=1 Tax=Clostridium magnum DSM 2767 TaxID=1121326 RepID=A0A162R0D9_9CLOT|nr:CoA transferase subunit A [Clostridium magnum]KZL89234.1 acetate CoA-transferase subunit alpha [Clostridium magnum DSM 2767]SHJ37282.1 butyryl-CoA:acetoacetate CoA-transferase alpha subunit [Clostridium magnum DSM 2767]
MGRTRQINAKAAASMIKDGMTVMIGGFMANGTPEAIIDALVEAGTKDLTIICNDAGLPGRGTEKLLQNKQIKKLIASHVGLTPECGRQYSEGELELELTPQGTLAEKIRSGGAGLGGFLTPTGIGTIVAEGKKVIEIDGKDYLLEKPLKADVSIIKGHIADEFGNIRYRGSTRNFNPMMATAADIVIAEVDKIVPAGSIGPEFVETPGIYVDYIVGGEA